MFFSSKSQIFAILFAIALVVLLFFAPKKPDISEVEIQNDVATEIEMAVKMIREGNQPMEGIIKLRSIGDKYPDNEEAQLYLGVFSIQSTQYEKAVERFNNVLKINPNNSYAYQLLGQSYELLQDTLKALEYYQMFLNKSDDVKAKEEIKKHLKNLKI